VVSSRDDLNPYQRFLLFTSENRRLFVAVIQNAVGGNFYEPRILADHSCLGSIIRSLVMNDSIYTRLTAKRFGFTLLALFAGACIPIGLMIFLPYMSLNSVVRNWSAYESLYFSLSILAGPFAFASNQPTSWVMVFILVPCCVAYAIRPNGITTGVTAIGWLVWMWWGLIVTFANV